MTVDSSTPLTRRIDEATRRRFEADWRAGRPEPVERYLPAPDDPVYLATLEELVAIDLEFRWKALADGGSDDAALGILEIALSAGGGDDWEYTVFARDLLASIHVKRGNLARATQQYSLILQQAYRTEFIRRAKTFLEKLETPR